MTEFPPERRKNPARKKMDLAYQVVWNEARRSFDIHRGGNPTGSYAHDRDTAIGLAVRGARSDAQQGVRVGVYSVQDGKQQTEWTSWSGT